MITEAREGGTAGIFRKDGDMRTGLIDEIAHEVSVDDLIFEAPTKGSQAWFVQHFGPNVNLGNIPPDEVIPLETLRLGLRGDTLKEILLAPEPDDLHRACDLILAPFEPPPLDERGIGEFAKGLIKSMKDASNEDIAAKVRHCAEHPELLDQLGLAARAKVAREGLWPTKAARLVALEAEQKAKRDARYAARKGKGKKKEAAAAEKKSDE